MAFKFEKLEVWKESVELSSVIHNVTLSFPKDELYVLTSQIKRAADSVSLNIAEGSTGQTNAEFRRFLSFAIRSGIEVIGCIYLAKKRNLINEEDFNFIYSATDSLVMRIQALKKSIPIK
ncbi:MAG TPA: four helix bundle protein [Cyclobacteriaceae bacterium]|jgi:four helix bundle protein|nr:four helix bundle protein [Cyclobacteriaceae bacterium]